MKKKIFIVAAVIISSQLLAQPVPQGGEGDSLSKTLDEVIFIANKYPKKQSETGKVITVINRLQLDRSGGKSLGEVLNTVAGTTILGANNNLGTNQTVSIRGASAGNVLILIDGIPVNDPSVITNYFDLNLFSIDQIERIEIMKGGQSTLYGSDAVAGVINIITRKNIKNKLGINAGFTAGSYNTLKENIGLSGANNKLNYRLQYAHLNGRGFSAAFDSVGNKNFDKDGINQDALNGGLTLKFSEKLNASFSGQYNYYKTDLDAAAFTDEKDYTVKNKNLQAGSGLIYNHSNGELHFNYLFNYVSRDYLDDSTYKSNPYVDYSKSKYVGRTHYAELYSNWKWNAWELLAGIDFRHNHTKQEYFSTGPFGPYSPPILIADMSQISPYASLIYKSKTGFVAEWGGRWNYHSVYGNNFTYTINPSWLVNKKLKAFVNLYSAFKTPTLYQLFDPSIGNPNLGAEKSSIVEGGFDLFLNNSFRTRIVGFYRNTKNAIQYIVTDPATFSAQYRNASKEINYGSEIESAFSTGKWNFNINYTYTDGKIKSTHDETGTALSKDTTYYNLYRIPKNVLNFTAGVQITKSVYISSLLKIAGKRLEPIYASSPKELKGYYTINLYGEYKISKIFKTFLDLKNITDQQYFDILGYNSKRFNFTAGINIKL